jgi:uncharacterized protein YidB (DUF937 family)
MGIFSSLADAVLHAETGQMPNTITAALGNTSLGGLAGIVSQLEQGGLASQVQSWLGPGTNLPITADQLRSALSDQHVQQIARQLGLPVDAAMQILAQHLPAAVDRASPTGTIQSQS